MSIFTNWRNNTYHFIISRLRLSFAILFLFVFQKSFHSSRHTFATLLVVDGVDIYKISKYLGHKSVNMTQRYLKYDLSIARESARGIHTFS
ncbi:tyrosine-type recombinase/integrase [Bacteroides sp. HPS0048]|uniref:tyrosine-type recombinase/integrase n=1 Tax=Bacteroides sp. HPS0048 TaxID=1078089 RepID=UPI0029349EA7|nr:tyrosine-type recombinase/integrase [Bacteroides sp. HPS0048]